ncbi:hypothetical protein CFR76_16120 [Komagataeibacter swingsii]|uniref:Transposase n=1 Tax=Komagataeibacter swingsii TaxID=215220 RepID=A0A2V4S871_9PROT|nr:hypothetical protein CFR76_16120 [Komagataeibacter swingsii]GBQ59965.1 hypothetical protein AA16373_1733 [Komagataeibacter swingsii DSM 16373]
MALTWCVRRKTDHLMMWAAGMLVKKLRTALVQLGQWTIEIVRRSDGATGFVVLPGHKRSVTQRTACFTVEGNALRYQTS